MRGISAKDGQFLFNTLVISLMVMALLFTIQPYINSGDSKHEVVAQMDRKLVDVRPSDLDTLVHSSNGKPVMLMLYASWCGYCKSMMPMLVELAKNGRMNTVQPVFISLDDQPRLLSKYLVHNGYDDVFTPYRFRQGFSVQPFTDFIQKTGSHYRGSIPYLGFFYPNGKLITDAAGVVSKNDVLTVLERIQQIQSQN